MPGTFGTWAKTRSTARARAIVQSAKGWIGGVNGAEPGIIMLAQPHSGDSYKQEYLPGVAQDQARVTAVGVTAKMARDDAYQSSYSNCIVTKEWTVLEPGAIEFKTYCPN